MKCGKLIHRGGRYVRMDDGFTTRCLNCGTDIPDTWGPGIAILLL